MLDQLGLNAPAPLSVVSLLVNLGLATVLALLTSWHYERFGRTYANRSELAWVFPLITLSTVLVISVVKSSLALSLGLVGALSIVRFRTPIKEPEELAYLFLAIAIGLGLGADQRFATLVGYAAILGVLTVRAVTSPVRATHNLYLNIQVPQRNGYEDVFTKINKVLSGHVQVADMRRIDSRDGQFQATYFIDCDDSDRLADLLESLNGSLPGVEVSFVEQRAIPGE